MMGPRGGEFFSLFCLVGSALQFWACSSLVLKVRLPRDLCTMLYFELLCLSAVEQLRSFAYPKAGEMTDPPTHQHLPSKMKGPLSGFHCCMNNGAHNLQVL